MMKKIILLLIVILMSSIFVTASEMYTVKSIMKTGDASCYVNGQVMFPVTTDKSNYYLDRIKFITAINSQTGKYIPLSGKWYDKDFNEIVTVKNGEDAFFVSDEYLLNNKSSYEIHLSLVPLEVISEIEYATSLKYDVTCPGYKHSCKYIDLSIEKCYSDMDYFYTYYNGVGAKHYSKVDLYKDISYLLNHNGISDQSSYLTPLPSSYGIEDVGDDNYILKIQGKDLREYINSIKIDVSGCIETLYDVSSFERCYFVNESSKKEQIEIKKDESKVWEEKKPIPLKYQQTNQTQEPEDIDFVYKIIAFFKRLFSFLKR